jgi:uncharacterized delta-60 repeat protein
MFIVCSRVSNSSLSLFIFLLLLALYCHQPTRAQSLSWAQRYNNTPKENRDRTNCIAKDASGNIYTAGYTYYPGNERDFLVLKYDASGNLIWEQRINSNTDEKDEAKAITVDAPGNVYITGVGDDDFFTVKLNSSGQLQWETSYDGAGTDYDEAIGIVTDASGNVFIAGLSDADPTIAISNNVVVIKYNANGVQQWIQTYNGTGNLNDQPSALGIDASGNVYISGFTEAAGGNQNLLVLKYNTSGVLQFTKNIDVSGNDDVLNELALDASFLYVTGETDNGDDDDYITYKYDLSGAQQWVKTYDFGDNDRTSGIDVDANGNVFVTGRSKNTNDDFDVATIKYNSAGTQQWVNRYNAGFEDRGTGIVADAAGNCFVTGYTFTSNNPADVNFLTLYCSGAGAATVLTNFNDAGNDIDRGYNLVFADGNAFAVGYGNNGAPNFTDALLFKYNASAQLFMKRYNGLGENSDKFFASVVDANGNIYATGYSHTYLEGRNILTAKFNSAGVLQWTQQFNSIAADDKMDEGAAITLDGAGNVLVAGTGNDDLYVLKYNTSGTLLWNSLYAGITKEDDEPVAILTDANNNIYVVGDTDTDPTNEELYDIVLLKYNSSGTLIANATYGTATNNDKPYDMVFDEAYNIYIAAKTGLITNEEGLVLKYNNALTQQWAKTYTNNLGNDRFDAVAAKNGNIWVAGRRGKNAEIHTLTQKYNSNGSLLWTKIDSTSIDARLYDISVDEVENTYVSGYSVNNNGNTDLLALKYNPDGVPQWKNIFDSGQNDEAPANALDCAGNLWLAGHSQLANGSFDMRLCKINGASGLTTYNTTWNHSSDLNDLADDIHIRYANNTSYITASGYSQDATNQNDAALWQYTQAITPIAAPALTGEVNTCLANTYTYTVPAVSGVAYNWTLTGNYTIVSGCNATSNTCTLTWTSGSNGTVNISEIGN